MIETPLHLALFLVGTLPIPLFTLFLAHADDGPVWRELPRRMVSFVGSLVLLGAVMLLVERFLI